MDRNQALQNIAKKGKVEAAVLEKELAEIIEQMPPSDNREKLALRELNNRYSGPDDKTQKFDLCIIGVFQITDFNKKAIKAGLDAYKNNPEQALENKLVEIVEGEPVALDLKETFGKDNIKNGNFGKPLGNSWNRNVLALLREDGAKEWAFGDVALRGDFARSSLPEMYKLHNCNLLGSIKDGLKTVKSSKFNVSDDAVDFNDQLFTLAEKKIFELGDCFDEAKTHSKDQEGFYRRFVITSGECKFMNDPKKEGGNYAGTVDDFTTDKMVQVFVDAAAGKPEVGQEYTYIAQTSIKKGWDKDTQSNTDEDILVMNVLGFYP